VIASNSSHVYAAGGLLGSRSSRSARLRGPTWMPMQSAMRRRTERMGSCDQCRVEIQRIVQVGGRLALHLSGGRIRALVEPSASSCAGRIADVDSLGPLGRCVASEREQARARRHTASTSNPSVYAFGDAVATSPKLSRLRLRRAGIRPEHRRRARTSPITRAFRPASFTVPGARERRPISSRRRAKDRVAPRSTRAHGASGRTYAETAPGRKCWSTNTDRIIGVPYLGARQRGRSHRALAISPRITAAEIRTWSTVPEPSCGISRCWGRGEIAHPHDRASVGVRTLPFIDSAGMRYAAAEDQRPIAPCQRAKRAR